MGIYWSLTFNQADYRVESLQKSVDLSRIKVVEDFLCIAGSHSRCTFHSEFNGVPQPLDRTKPSYCLSGFCRMPSACITRSPKSTPADRRRGGGRPLTKETLFPKLVITATLAEFIFRGFVV